MFVWRHYTMLIVEVFFTCTLYLFSLNCTSSFFSLKTGNYWDGLTLSHWFPCNPSLDRNYFENKQLFCFINNPLKQDFCIFSFRNPHRWHEIYFWPVTAVLHTMPQHRIWLCNLADCRQSICFTNTKIN